MSLKDKASLIFKPSRYKSGTAYSFRGSDVTVSRSSVGTRVNAEGKIEEVAADVPRLNYDPADLTKCPTLLVEKDTSNQVKKNDTIYDTDGVTIRKVQSPFNELEGFAIYEDSSSGQHYGKVEATVVNGTTYCLSFYVKHGTSSSTTIYTQSSSASSTLTVYFTGGELSLSTSGTNAVSNSYGKEYINDGWWRVWYQFTAIASAASMDIYIPPVNLNSYTGNTDVFTSFYGFQVEPSVSKPSSLIITTSTVATRADETVTASSPINGARGSFYFNLSQMDTIGYGTTVPTIALYKTNTTTGAIGLLDNNTTQGEMRAMARINGSLYYYNTHFSAPNGVKMCFVWDANDNDTKAYKNGVLWGTINQSFTQTLSDGLVLNASTRENFLEYEEVMVYNERLSEAEAIALTSYDDYQELVDRNELTWESPTITNNRLTALQEL